MREQKTAAASGRRKLKLLSASERGWRLQGCTKDGQRRQNRRDGLSRPRVSSLQSPASKAGILFSCSPLFFCLSACTFAYKQITQVTSAGSLVKSSPASFALRSPLFCLSACCMRTTQDQKLRSCRQMVTCTRRDGVQSGQSKVRGTYICMYFRYAH